MPTPKGGSQGKAIEMGNVIGIEAVVWYRATSHSHRICRPEARRTEPTKCSGNSNHAVKLSVQAENCHR